MLGGKNPLKRRRERISGEVVRPGARFSTVVSQRISPGIAKVASSHVTLTFIPKVSCPRNRMFPISLA